jgi:glycerophosphoryl diester phosphodiesterase
MTCASGSKAAPRRRWSAAVLAALAVSLGPQSSSGATAPGPTPALYRPPAGVLLAHALGGIDAATLTNSREAFDRSYGSGRRWFEVDLHLTADHQLFCFHETHEKYLGLATPADQLPLADLLKLKYLGRFTLMSFPELLELATEHDDVFIVTDTKHWREPMRSALAHDLAEVPAGVRQRIVPQIYQPANLEVVRAVERETGPLGPVIFTLYQTKMSDDQVLEFVKSTKVTIVTMHYSRFSVSFAKALHDLGVTVLVHTVNDGDQIMALVRDGADGFYTDTYFPTTEYAQHFRAATD